MKVTTTFVDQVRADSPAAADQFIQMQAAITAGWARNHNPDGTHGTIAATGTISERGRTVPLGESIPIWVAPSLFTAKGAMTWTVTVANVGWFYYTLIGTRMCLDFSITGTTVGGVVSDALYVTLPDGFYATRPALTLCRLFDNAAFTVGIAYVAKQSNLLAFGRSDAANFTAGATTLVQGQMRFEVGTS